MKLQKSLLYHRKQKLLMLQMLQLYSKQPTGCMGIAS